MLEAAFLIGRILALADVLHKDYCAVERDGNLPPTLIGNGLFASALDDPSRALEDLAERIRIYQAWAQTEKLPQGNDNVAERKRKIIWEAQDVLRRYGSLTPRLHDLGLPANSDMTAEMKAHLLLGYLADWTMDDNDTKGEDVQ